MASFVDRFRLDTSFGWWASLLVGGLADVAAIASAGVIVRRAMKQKETATGDELAQAQNDYNWGVAALIIVAIWIITQAMELYAYKS